ncbi:hypothetical protein [Rugosimonospora africana]|uniref:Uncharacterized protein n=1 Tax=Rugosimonospora africana TaxID=556532 RepID=A0A8J3R138_9ACTN|nr:hypothetical protein [Rugosimonospora africana]GIH19882.1 hypothetical protein Raf01_80540 [Rugosimonospora africana]
MPTIHPLAKCGFNTRAVPPLIVCEDGPGTTLLRGITAKGEIFPIASSVDLVNDVTGPTFSPDGSILFLNIMGEDPPNQPAMSFAVWGPWRKYA